MNNEFLLLVLSVFFFQHSLALTVVASGAMQSTYGQYTFYTYSTPGGNWNFFASESVIAQVLIVGGGGCGGGTPNIHDVREGGGGGGAGRLGVGTLTFDGSGVCNIVIGKGGSQGRNGEDSSITCVTMNIHEVASGGGSGGFGNVASNSGGCGGGASGFCGTKSGGKAQSMYGGTLAYHGNDGGEGFFHHTGAGGGGAGSAGQSDGSGGNGYIWEINNHKAYAGGGGGGYGDCSNMFPASGTMLGGSGIGGNGGRSGNERGFAAAAGTGSGGGGVHCEFFDYGSSGSDGVVIIAISVAASTYSTPSTLPLPTPVPITNPTPYQSHMSSLAPTNSPAPSYSLTTFPSSSHVYTFCTALNWFSSFISNNYGGEPGTYYSEGGSFRFTNGKQQTLNQIYSTLDAGFGSGNTVSATFSVYMSTNANGGSMYFFWGWKTIHEIGSRRNEEGWYLDIQLDENKRNGPGFYLSFDFDDSIAQYVSFSNFRYGRWVSCSFFWDGNSQSVSFAYGGDVIFRNLALEEFNPIKGVGGKIFGFGASNGDSSTGALSIAEVAISYTNTSPRPTFQPIAPIRRKPQHPIIFIFRILAGVGFIILVLFTLRAFCGGEGRRLVLVVALWCGIRREDNDVVATELTPINKAPPSP